MTTKQLTKNVFSKSHMHRGSISSVRAIKPSTNLLSNNGCYDKIVDMDECLQQESFDFNLKKNNDDSMKMSNEKIIIEIDEIKIEFEKDEKDEKDENDCFDGNSKDTLDVSLNSFSSTSTLSHEEDLYNPNPRVLFKKHWVKNLPERVESFSDQPFPLRETLSRNCSADQGTNEANKSNSISSMKEELSQSSILFEEKRKRFIFGLGSDRNFSHSRQKKITHTSSDIILENTWKLKPKVRKIPSTSLLLRKNNMEGKSRNVRFNPRIAVVEYERTLQFYAKDDWEKYYV